MLSSGYVYWKSLLEINKCFKCQKEITFLEERPEEDKEYHPDCFVKKEGVYHGQCYVETNNEKLRQVIQENKMKEFSDWKELLRKYSCFNCGYSFSDEEIQQGNWQVDYYDCYGVKEINLIKHSNCFGCCECKLCKKAHKNLKDSQAKCSSCDKKFGNLIIRDYLERTYHLECFEKNKTYLFHSHPKILVIKVDKERITATFENERQVSISTRWVLEKYHWLKKKFKPEQIKDLNYKIDEDGFRVDFWTDNEDNEEFDLTVHVFEGRNNYLGKCGCCSASEYDHLTERSKSE